MIPFFSKVLSVVFLFARIFYKRIPLNLSKTFSKYIKYKLDKLIPHIFAIGRFNMNTSYVQDTLLLTFQ
jgi:hypothetical protein